MGLSLDLEGKVALVAAASRGLGYAVAEALASEGARLSIVSRNRSSIEEAAERIRNGTGAEVHARAVDLRSGLQISAWAEGAGARFGGADLLFVNSGGPPPGSFQGLDETAWREAFDLIVMSAVRTTSAALPLMRAGGGGSILFSTSSSVKEPIPGLMLSNVLRASIAALSKNLALELAPDGIRVNQLIPGRIETERVTELDRRKAEAEGAPVEEVASASKRKIPLGRYGLPREYAAAAAFLLSGAASYVTGATLQVDGGKLRGVF